MKGLDKGVNKGHIVVNLAPESFTISKYLDFKISSLIASQQHIQKLIDRGYLDYNND